MFWNRKVVEYENSTYRFTSEEGKTRSTVRTNVLRIYKSKLENDDQLTEVELDDVDHIERAIRERDEWLRDKAPEWKELRKRIAGLLVEEVDDSKLRAPAKIKTTPSEEQPAIGNLARTLWIAFLVIIAGAALL